MEKLMLIIICMIGFISTKSIHESLMEMKQLQNLRKIQRIQSMINNVNSNSLRNQFSYDNSLTTNLMPISADRRMIFNKRRSRGINRYTTSGRYPIRYIYTTPLRMMSMYRPVHTNRPTYLPPLRPQPPSPPQLQPIDTPSNFHPLQRPENEDIHTGPIHSAQTPVIPDPPKKPTTILTNSGPPSNPQIILIHSIPQVSDDHHHHHHDIHDQHIFPQQKPIFFHQPLNPGFLYQNSSIVVGQYPRQIIFQQYPFQQFFPISNGIVPQIQKSIIIASPQIVPNIFQQSPAFKSFIPSFTPTLLQPQTPVIKVPSITLNPVKPLDKPFQSAIPLGTTLNVIPAIPPPISPPAQPISPGIIQPLIPGGIQTFLPGGIQTLPGNNGIFLNGQIPIQPNFIRSSDSVQTSYSATFPRHGFTPFNALPGIVQNVPVYPNQISNSFPAIPSHIPHDHHIPPAVGLEPPILKHAHLVQESKK